MGYIIGARTGRGVGYFLKGQLELALPDLDFVLENYEPDIHFSQRYLALGIDVGIAAFPYAEWTYTLLGWPEKSRKISEKELNISNALNHDFSRVYSLMSTCNNEHFIRNPERILKLSMEGIRITEELDFPFFNVHSRIYRGWALAQTGKINEGTTMIEDGLNSYPAMLLKTCFLTMLSECYALKGNYTLALSTLKKINTLLETSEERFMEAEILRLEGVFLEKAGAPLDQVKLLYRRSIKIAQKQYMMWWELRSTVALARLMQIQEQHDQAYQKLKLIYEKFSEGFDTIDLKEAKSLLDELEP